MPSSTQGFGSSIDDMMLTISAQNSAMLQQMACATANPSNFSPAELLALQYQMTQLSQSTEAASNLIAGMNNILSNILRNLKGS